MDAAEGAGGRVRQVLLLRLHAGPRTRSVDEHMFRVDRSSFRLQLFTAPGLRPVAVATQTVGEGASLMNRAERFAEAIWQRHCPTGRRGRTTGLPANTTLLAPSTWPDG